MSDLLDATLEKPAYPSAGNSENRVDDRLLLPPEEVARRLSITRKKLYDLWTRGDGPRRVRIGVRVYCRPQALVEFIEAHEEPVDVS